MTDDLTLTEQRHVRAALRFLFVRAGGWVPLADALRCHHATLNKMVTGKRPVSASIALRVARLADVGIGDLLEGRYLPQGTCPHCGRPPDFADEATAVEGGPRGEPGGGLKLVR